MNGPTPHLSWRELACRDRLRTPYPLDYRTDPTRLPVLGEAFEALHAQVGLPLVVTCGYRTPAHNRQEGGAPNSQHVVGRALDIRVPEGWAPEALAAVARGIEAIKGVGWYPARPGRRAFIHIDVRLGDHRPTWREDEDGRVVRVG